MHYSRRKFIATAASGVAATAVTPMALAANQPGTNHASSTMESSRRVKPSEFIIFPWGGMPAVSYTHLDVYKRQMKSCAVPITLTIPSDRFCVKREKSTRYSGTRRETGTLNRPFTRNRRSRD